jgi:hypothetical protein
MMDDVCTLNNKTEAQKQEVLKVLTHYGTVEDYDTVVASERAKYQAVIDNQTKQIEAIKDQDLTTDEMAMVKAYRVAVSGVVAEHKAVEAECRKTIDTLESTLTQFKNKIIAVVGE